MNTPDTRNHAECATLAGRAARGGNEPMAGTTSSQGFGLVEVLVAITFIVIGLLAATGLHTDNARESRIGEWQSTQSVAAHQVLDRIRQGGYAAAQGGSYQAEVDGRSYTVTVIVAQVAPHVKQVTAQVPPILSSSDQMFVTRIYEPRPLPASR